MLAIIPARGGSKGLPGKNIRPLAGVPLICHTIKSALESKNITRVIVSTDDNDIASVARECGAEVPFIRPVKLSKDNSMVMDTYFYIIEMLKKEKQVDTPYFIALLPTAPLRVSEDIDAAIKIFESNKADSVISVTESEVPLEWYRKIDDHGILTGYFPNENAINNRQDFKKSYVPNGAIYVFRTERLRETRRYYMDKTYPYIMPKNRSIDIDDISDFELADLLILRDELLNKF
jgi:N-acylneuraminate cytidylyltransferase/CMP-N,N'-diacetyllegionaminic acid synthase